MLSKIILLLSLYITTAISIKWTVQNAENKTCLILQADEVEVNLNAINAITGATMPLNFTINSTISVAGNCGETETLEVAFLPNGKKPDYAKGEKPWTLRVRFGIESRSTGGHSPSWTDYYYLANYEIEITRSAFFNTTFQNFSSSYERNTNIIDSDRHFGFNCSSCHLPLTADSTVDIKNISMISHALLDKPDIPEGLVFQKCRNDWRWYEIVAAFLILFIVFVGFCIVIFAFDFFCNHRISNCFDRFRKFFWSRPNDYHTLSPSTNDGQVNDHLLIDGNVNDANVIENNGVISDEFVNADLASDEVARAQLVSDGVDDVNSGVVNHALVNDEVVEDTK